MTAPTWDRTSGWTMTSSRIVPGAAAFLLCDLQNDFLHPEGAYGRAGLFASVRVSPWRKVIPA